MTPFDRLGLSGSVLEAVKRLGYENPTPVQEQAIPLLLEGRDIIAAAKTGTGKTAAFALPAMDRIGRARKGRGPLMLVVTPTRELAQQIAQVCGVVAESTGHSVATVVGGVGMEPQIKALKRGVDVLVATPGRLLDLMGQDAVALDDVEILVLDEADRMLDMGFWPSVKRIVDETPAARQTLLFSATIDETVRRTAAPVLHKPAVVEIAHKGETADKVEQFIVRTTQGAKPAVLKAVLQAHGASRVIVFARTRSRADATCRRLKRAGFSAEAIHSDRSQNQRRRALDNFAAGRTNVLVATDVLARGIDVDEVSYVVNLDLPAVPEDYVHRIGRTGRAGAEGFAVSFVTPETEGSLRDIEKLTRRSIPELPLPGFDMDAAIAEAEVKAQNAAARRDPEIAEAKREMANRAKKKARVREKAREERDRAATGKKSQRIAKAGKSSEPKRPQKAPKDGKLSEPHRGDKTRARDVRPGRAHRAAVAKQRTQQGARPRHR